MVDQKRDRKGSAATKEGGTEPDPPPAGPHATKELTNEDATPGAGSLPDNDAPDDTGGVG